MSKPVLGRGLSALLGGKPLGGASAGTTRVDAGPRSEAALQEPGSQRTEVGAERVAIGRLRPSALQPRREFPEETLRELADSIREQGILQPLVARRQGDGLELIAGERRWRAAQLIGLTEVPVLIREADDTTALEWMLVENLQREGLNSMDEAQGYSELMDRFRLTQEAVATRVGKNRASVANALRLLKLPEDVQALIRGGQVSTGHAKVILGLSSPALQTEAARRVVSDGLSVRQAEELISRLGAEPAPTKDAPRQPGAGAVRDPHVVALEDKLRQRLGTKVSLRYRQGRGQIDIRFFSDADLERVLDLVGVRLD